MLPQRLQKYGKRPWMFYRERKIFRKWFVDPNATVFLFTQPHPSATHLTGRKIVRNCAASVLRDRNSSFVQRFPHLSAEIVDYLYDVIATVAVRKIPDIHRLVQSHDVRELVQ